jgi:CubicO group peptidase (beta-lactamase class C family)
MRSQLSSSPLISFRLRRDLWRWLALCLFATVATANADLDRAAAFSAREGERALLVWEKGRLVKERYGNGGAADRPENLYSITKTLCALGVLAAVGRRSLNLDEQVSDTLTEWRKDPEKKKITVRQLLNQTSGLDPGYETLYNKSLKNKNTAVLKLGQRSAPGESFAYGPAHYEALEAFIARKTGESASTWEQNIFLRPTNIFPSHWRTDQRGNPYFSAGLFVTPRALLKAAQLTRRRGWILIFPFIPSALMREAATGSAANPMYGYGCWLNRNAGQPGVIERDVEEAISNHLTREDWKRSCLSKAAPTDLIAFVGSGGQRVYISPSRSLVIVRFGRDAGFRDPDFLRAYFR